MRSAGLLGLVVVGMAGVVVASTTSRVVPPDRSLDVEAYMALGVPDPGTAWSVTEHLGALAVLGELDRTLLPRRGSARSEAVFDRLVEEEFRDVELPLAAPSAHVLYSSDKEDGLIFDREWVALKAALVASSLELCRSDVIREPVLERAPGHEDAPPGAQRENLRQVRALLSGLIAEGLQAMLAVAMHPASRPEALDDVDAQVDSIAPELARCSEGAAGDGLERFVRVNQYLSGAGLSRQERYRRLHDALDG